MSSLRNLKIPMGDTSISSTCSQRTFIGEKGVGSRLLTAVLDYARKTGIGNVKLHASDMGRPLFLVHGFTESSEMSILLG